MITSQVMPNFLTPASLQDRAIGRSQNFAIRAVGLLGLSLAGLFIAIAICGRLQTDDYTSFTAARDAGVFGSASHWWSAWNGRWVERVLSGVCTLAFFRSGVSWPVTIFGYGMLVAGIAVLFWAISGCAKSGRSKACCVAASLCVTGASLMASEYRGDSWFWLVGSITYIWPMGGVALATGLLLAGGRGRSMIAIVIAAGCSAMAEGPALLLLAVLLVSLIGNHCLVAARRRTGTFLVAFIVVLSVFATSVIAPGNQKRWATEQATSHSFSLVVREVVRQPVLLLKRHAVWIIVSVAAGFAVVLGENDPANASSPSLRDAFRRLAVVVGGYLVACVLLVAPVVYAMANVPPRVGATLAIVTMFAAALIGMILASVSIHRRLAPFGLCAIGALMLCISARTVTEIRRQAPIAAAYARSFDSMHASLLRLGNSPYKGDVVVAELAPHGWLADANPTLQTSHWINQSMASAYGLHGALRRATPEEMKQSREAYPGDILVPGASRESIAEPENLTR